MFADIGPAPAAKSAARSAPKKEPKKRCKKRPAHEADLASPAPKSKPARAQACQTPNFNYVEVEEQLRALILSRDLKTTSVTQILRRLESTLGLRFSTLDQQTGQTLVKQILAEGDVEMEKEAMQQAGMFVFPAAVTLQGPCLVPSPSDLPPGPCRGDRGCEM